MESVTGFLRAMSINRSIILKHKEKLKVVFAALLAFLLTVPMLSYAQYQDSETIPQGTISSLMTPVSMERGLSRGAVEGIRLADTKAMKEFYQSRDNAPFWVNGDNDRARAEGILSVLENSWTHGMNPQTYHAGDIRKLLESSRPNTAKLELLLTDAIIRYGRDITGMRVDPESIRQQAKFWRKPMTSEAVLAAVTTSPDPGRALEKLAPQDKFYKALRDELVRLTSEQEKFDGILPIDLGGLLRPGDGHRAVPKIRARLGVEHRDSDGPKTFYDDRLAAAVMAFQRSYELDGDGIIGSKTLELLNRTNREKMEQVVANLERLRWLEQQKPQRYVLVNLPSQMLWAVEDGKTAFEMKVVVGMPWRATRDFTTTVTGVRFNPTWTVPYGIKMADMLPKLKEDPYALTDKGIEFFKGYGTERVTIDPATINWDKISNKEASEIRMIQTSGDHNALGYVRILMDNEFNMYMHDTNHRELFDLADRTKSSGCIRLHEPEKMARWVLSHNKDLTKHDIRRKIDSGETEDIKAADSFPVYVVYQTIWQDKSGKLVFGADIYKRDKKLIEALAAQNGFWLPEKGKQMAMTNNGNVTTLASAE